MGFMDGVTNFTKGVGAKAKGNYDVVNLNSQINSLSKEITNIYTSIGERYYTLHKDAPEACFEGMFKEVNDRVAAINRMQREIENTKENMAAVQLINSQPQVTRYCVKCGSPIEAGNSFCVKCGAKQPDKSQEAVSAPVVAEPVAFEEGIEAKCPDCGALLKEGASFCTSCGRQI